MIAAALAVLTLGAMRAVAVAADPVLTLSAEDAREIAANLGPDVVGRALPAPLITDAGTYFPLVERGLTYKVTVGSNVGQTQTLQLAKGQRPGGTPAWRFQISPTLSAFRSQNEAAISSCPRSATSTRASSS
jgi:hypothetical protein